MKTYIFLIIFIIASIFVSGCTLEEESEIIIEGTPEGTVPPPTPFPVDTATLTPEETGVPTENITRWKADGVIEDGEYENEVTGFRDLFYIYWTSDEGFLYMGIKGKTAGWIGVGFNPTVIMKDADIIMGGNKGSGGDLYIYDMYCIATTGPNREDTALGGTFDLIEFAGAEESAFQTIEFSRKLDTGDKYDSVLVKGEPAKVLWALSYSDSVELKHNAGKGTVEIIV